MKPVIGITSDFTSSKRKPSKPKEEDTYFLRARYVRAIEDLGGIPFVLPPPTNLSLGAGLLERVDALLITGSGEDLDPRWYGEKKRFSFDVMTSQRAHFERAIIKRAIREDRVVLALCGGLQALNVTLGGSLIQDIRTQIPRSLNHRQEPPTTKPSHEVEVYARTQLRQIVKAKTISVNSSHHQSPGRVAEGLVINARSIDGVIEGLEAPQSRFVIGVQWHPELLYRNHLPSRRLFRAFLKAAAGTPSNRWRR